MATLEEKLEGLRCPRCGRENSYVPREIEHVAKVGNDTVAVTVRAGVCSSCGEQLLDGAAMNRIEESEREMPCPVCGAPMPDLKGGKNTICPNCGFKDSCCY